MLDKERFMKIVDDYGLRKAVLLIILTFQATFNTILVKYSTSKGRPQYFKSTLVVWMEARSVRKFVQVLYRDIFNQPMNCLKVSVPAVLYVLQNNLLLMSIHRLDVATFQVTSQLKIITTAFFCVCMLKKRLRVEQWIAIVILTLGISVVGITQSKASGSQSFSHSTNFKSYILGLVFLLMSCVLSGFSGVYFEKILKGSGFSIWILNIQLGFFGAIASLMFVLIRDLKEIRRDGFLAGYDYVVWCLALYQAVGGLVIAMVIKYADNILKGFATSCSIILSAVLSYYIFSTPLSYCLMLGALLVIISVILYGVYAK